MSAAKPPSWTSWFVIGATSILLTSAASIGIIMGFWSNLFHNNTNAGSSPDTKTAAPLPRGVKDPFAEARRHMVDVQLRARDISDQTVLHAMNRVPRHQFVPKHLQEQAYHDYPLPIGFGQTISQPYIVALMTQLGRPSADCRALEVGVGSGYQTAILAELCKEVFGVEIHRPLADDAPVRLAALGYKNVAIRCGDGYRGWLEYAPFDIILVTAAPNHVPEPLIEQLAPGGRLVIPVGLGYQELLLIEKQSDGSLHRRVVAPVQFVPMTGQAEQE